MIAAPSDRPLSGVRIVEISSFVAVPLAGMSLAQLGAEVVRVDPVGGAADYRRWPLTDAGESIYWAGLNKGKRSMAVDMRSPEGQRLVQRLIAEAGVLITNATGRQWHSYPTLSAQRPDLILLDMQLPDISGLELLRHLKADEAVADIPVIVVSADATASRMQEALTLGALHYVTKPVNVAGFLHLLDEVLDSLDTRWGA